MKKERIVRYSSDKLPSPGKTDWARIGAMTDEDIDRAIADDPDAAPIMPDEFFENLDLLMPSPEGKERITMMVDRDVLRFFKQDGPGYQGRINAVLKAYAKAEESRRKA